MISLSVIVTGETTPAIAVRLRGRPVVWLPKELIDIEREREDGSATLWITKELATSKGLV